ncbi:riboflavin synthase subunit alpha [Shewanella sp. SM20]|uniref:riboflavin synthase subunit alpha n=1 Tax=Shewanella TaxID=22 RepID=UPI0021D8A6E9|nr:MULTISPECIES: riboflavin synthase subunit alpha [unclassified Shewanella]MCU7964643.1 riboflavin synthase subunit alpha [Shewanella sp. SW32]MCU7972568.1 riboflavin synthase subunit alpha [Shewanella sp. SW29]MCU8092469.1 riboflavin synthase subunit alpha [Shewanella sp. SM20]
MFTGIVQATCEVVAIHKKDGLNTLEVAFEPDLHEGLAIGASVANNGVCLTVTQVADDRVFFDVVEETLRLTNLANLSVGQSVNVERSLTFGSEIGGHILSGHIHTKAKVIDISHTEQHYDLTLGIEPKWMDYIFYKGFVGINGCSLTVGEVSDSGFKLHLIPETLKLTNLSQYKVGDELNIEIDSQTQIIVDTVERVLARRFNEQAR